MALMKFCRKSGCKNLTADKFCADHPEQVRQYDQNRPSAAKRGYGRQWRNARDGFLRKHPLCVECQKSGQIVAATVVDHIKAHKGNKDLFWDRDNWQPLCKKHHDQKTVREDGGFGR